MPAPSVDQAEAVVVPVPFERTVSYGTGTADGPRALLEASTYLELYDEQLDRRPADIGVATVEPVEPPGGGRTDNELATAIDAIGDVVAGHLASGQFPIVVGGEHSLTSGPVRAARDVAAAGGDALGVVQFDAHADLRDRYEGLRYSHAAVMRRIVDDLELPTLAVGLRSLSTAEALLIRRRDLPTIWSHELHEDALAGSTARFERLLESLPQRVYLTFDLDYFDPALLPATGTPEPGGGDWFFTLALLRRLFALRDVVAMDLVELAPRADAPSSAFVAAKLAYKCLGFRFLDRLEPLASTAGDRPR